MPDSSLTNIPAPRVAFVDPRTGHISREWYRWLLNLFTLTGGGQNVTTLTDLQLGPPDVPQDTMTTESLTTEMIPWASQADIAEIKQELNSLRFTATNEIQENFASFYNELQALKVIPPPYQTVNPRYGMFYSTSTQTASLADTATQVTFNSTVLNLGVTLSSNKVYIDTPGVYSIQYSVHTVNTSGTAYNLRTWLRLNGADLTYSCRHKLCAGNNDEDISASCRIGQVAAGDYVELFWAVSNTALTLDIHAATAYAPAVPSATISVVNNISAPEVYS